VLRERIPHVSLATLPTPVEPLPALAEELGLAGLVVKRDDLTSETYGGNKVRKLEFLLGAALDAGATETLTFGAAGSNHATATALYAARLGLRPTSLLIDQPSAGYLRRNLLAQHAAGTRLLLASDMEARDAEAARLMGERLRETGRAPYLIPTGGSSPTGALGLVQAALELGAQADAGELDVPDVLYVAFGSMGTAAGLILGLAALGWPTRVVAVRVTPTDWADADKLRILLSETAALLKDAGVELPEPGPDAWRVDDSAFGGEYARFTPEGMAAIARVSEEGISLDGTYSGKAFGALLRDARRGDLAGERVLFWDTFNSRDMTPLIGDAEWHDLPEAFHHYFSEPVQELDR
jgi:1-aminocyclopropane-1-carboxylate deaminase/D-cysteine desulfhydrase-like pyridoxal-dependent ACC family enzyme